jgi:hypothetical protein
MSLAAKVFAYCERGADPGLLAEPLNAVTNGAFVVAAVALAPLLRGVPADRRSAAHVALPILIALIGIGSFLFHTVASRWAALADVVPIVLFMVLYLAMALRTLLRLPIAAVLLLTFGFVVSLWAAGQIRCDADGVITFGGGGGRCLNGSVGYLPAWLAMVATGAVLAVRRHPAGRAVLAAAVVFAASLAFRSLDAALCSYTVVGTHFLWHLLNAVCLFVLTRALILAPPSRAGS